MKAVQIPVHLIDVVGERRPVDREKVKALADSMSKVGLINPITVWAIDDEYVTSDGAVYEGANLLIAGAHRLAAAKQLGWEDISAVEFFGDEIDAQLMEIAENLHRSELTQLERSEQVARWVELTELQLSQVDSNENKRADGRGHRKQGGARAAARELGISQPDANRSVKVASISERAKEAARQAGLDDNRSALLQVAKAAPEAQEAVVHSIAQAKATRTIMSEDEKRDKWLNSLLKAWEAADQHTRETFLEMIDRPVMGKQWG